MRGCGQTPGLVEKAEDPLLALLQAALERTAQLSRTSREHLATAQSWNSLLQQSREHALASFEPARDAIAELSSRIQQFESEASSVLTKTTSALETLRQGEAAAQTRHRQAHTEVAPILLRLRQLRADAAARLAEQRALTLQSLAEAEVTARAVQSAVTSSAASVQSGVASSLELFRAARQGLQERAEQTFRQYETMQGSLAGALRELAAESEHARKETAARLRQLAERVERTGDETNPAVAERFAVSLVQEMRALADELVQAVRDLRSVAVRPRKLADTQVLTMMQKLRESLDLLQKVEKVFLLAKSEFC